MSQDIFDDLAEICESEGEDDPGSPIEFSGVSGSVKSNEQSPASQPIPPSGILPDLSTNPVPLVPFFKECPVCRPKKKYKTERGWNTHINDKHQGVVPAIPSTSSTPTQSVAENSMQGFICQLCQKSLKKRSSFVAHQARHRLDDLCSKKPPPADFEKKKSEVIQKIINEMLSEPNYGDESNNKIKFLTEFATIAEESEIVSELIGVICSYVCCKSTRIFPLAQYEEAQQKLNFYLNDDNNMKSLKLKLASSCNQEISSDMAARLVTRIAFKLMNQIQCWAASEMRATLPQQEVTEEARPVTEMEEGAFIITLGNIFRAFFKKGFKSKSRLWQSASSCLQSAFVIGPHPIRSSQFLNKSNWFSGNEGSIVPCDSAVSFFKNVEKVINLSSVAKEKFPSAEEVTNQILLSSESLNYWYNLTHTHISEEDSLLFMRELIYSFVSVSRQLEESRRNRLEDKTVRGSTVALRTHLQRNFTGNNPDSIE